MPPIFENPICNEANSYNRYKDKTEHLRNDIDVTLQISYASGYLTNINIFQWFYESIC